MSTEGQLWLNTSVALAGSLPVALDVFVVYRACRFFPFTSAAWFVLAPYFAHTLQPSCGTVPAVIASIVFVGLMGSLVGAFIARQGHPAPHGDLPAFLIGLGFLVVVQNGLSILYGRQPLAFSLGLPTSVAPLGSEVLISGTRIVMLLFGMLALLTWAALEHLTWLGLQWRALGSNFELAYSIGLRTTRARVAAFSLGALLSATSGILSAADTAARPYMGVKPFMVAVVVVIVGGRNLFSLVVSATIVATVQHLGGYLLGSRWQDTLVFMLLLLVLLLRPSGLASTLKGVRPS